jgi:hypothetical protein
MCGSRATYWITLSSNDWYVLLIRNSWCKKIKRRWKERYSLQIRFKLSYPWRANNWLGVQVAYFRYPPIYFGSFSKSWSLRISYSHYILWPSLDLTANFPTLQTPYFKTTKSRPAFIRPTSPQYQKPFISSPFCFWPFASL